MKNAIKKKPADFVTKRMAAMTPERRARIMAEASELIRQSRLAHIREAVKVTQASLAERLNIKQASVSQIENQEDLKMSTLRRYVHALGGDIEVRVKIPHEKDMILELAGNTHK